MNSNTSKSKCYTMYRHFLSVVVLLAVSVLPFAYSGTTVNKDKLSSAGEKIVSLVLKKFVLKDADSIMGIIKDLADSVEIKPTSRPQQTVSELLEKKGATEQATTGLDAFVLENGEVIGPNSFFLRGSRENALIYFSTQNGKDEVLRNVLVEADITVEKFGDVQSNQQGFQTIAIGGRGYKGFPYWRGYSFQLLAGGIIKVCDEGYDDKIACQQTGINPVGVGDEYHMLLTIKDNSAFITLFDTKRRAKYKDQCSLSQINMQEKGNYVYLFAWKADVKFTNVKITGL